MFIANVGQLHLNNTYTLLKGTPLNTISKERDATHTYITNFIWIFTPHKLSTLYMYYIKI